MTPLAPLAQSAEHIHGKDGVAGSIPAGGSTLKLQVRPGLGSGLFHAREALNRHLPEICQKTLTVVVRTHCVAPRGLGLHELLTSSQLDQRCDERNAGWRAA